MMNEFFGVKIRGWSSIQAAPENAATSTRWETLT
jgi:hypothetical protein